MSEQDIEKLDGKTLDIVEQNIAQLKQLFPSIFSEGKIQFNKLEELLGNYVSEDEDHYNFTWHGKRKAGRLAQTPSTGTLRPCKEESVDWDNTENLFIEGDNLEVLKLLQKSYHRQVKMIYIDPPYNTGNDFVYEDDFKDGVKNYLEMTGQVDSDGKKMGTNSSSAGRYHTNWLNMMYPRLKLARNLLRDDGVIFISIDDNEQANLKKICDEIFGEENFAAMLVWQSKSGGGHDEKKIVKECEYILCYTKKYEKANFGRRKLKDDTYILKDIHVAERGKFKLNKLDRSMKPKHYSEALNFPIKATDGSDIWPGPNDNKTSDWNWRWSRTKVQWGIENNWLEIKKNQKGDWSVYSKQYEFCDHNGEEVLRDYPYRCLVTSAEFNTTQGNKDILNIFDKNVFDYSKPVGLMKRLIEISASKEGIALDLFAGSSALAQASYELQSQCKFVAVQIPELVPESSVALEAGYKNLADISKERIRRAAKKIKEENPDYEGDLGFKVFKLDSSNIKSWDAGFDTLESDLMDAVDYLVKNRTDEDVLYELCLKLGLDLSITIEEKTIAGKKLFILGRGYLVVCLDDAITMDLVNGIGALKDELAPEDGMRVVFKDDGFKDDVVKTNALQTLKRFGIDDIKSL